MEDVETDVVVLKLGAVAVAVYDIAPAPRLAQFEVVVRVAPRYLLWHSQVGQNVMKVPLPGSVVSRSLNVSPNVQMILYVSLWRESVSVR